METQPMMGMVLGGLVSVLVADVQKGHFMYTASHFIGFAVAGRSLRCHLCLAVLQVA